MIRSLLVPLDGSSFGEQALPMALSIAPGPGLRLKLVRVHEPLDFPDLILPALADGDRRARERARDYLDDVLERVSAVSPVEASQTLLQGSVADAICDFARARRTDLIVVATHGRGLLSRFWFGSVTTKLIELCPAGPRRPAERNRLQPGR